MTFEILFIPPFHIQILFEGKKAVGVVYKRDGKVRIAKARKEVILSAGTVATTKLLLLSGVGPRNHLQSLKVLCECMRLF